MHRERERQREEEDDQTTSLSGATLQDLLSLDDSFVWSQQPQAKAQQKEKRPQGITITQTVKKFADLSPDELGEAQHDDDSLITLWEEKLDTSSTDRHFTTRADIHGGKMDKVVVPKGSDNACMAA